VHDAYGRDEVVEQFRCNFGLNPAYRALVTSGPLTVAGVDRGGEVRVVELMHHRFFVATLFLPQLVSRPEAAHPLITAYLRAAVAFHDLRTEHKRPGQGSIG
jgi:CTP synthase (UTP-ammonia lyase)